jgi:glycosyltransferase involved in cell wall biosynthesis
MFAKPNNRKTKILFVIDNLQFGGGERVFSQIINGLPPDGYHVYLASGPGKSFLRCIEREDLNFIPLDFSSRYNLSLIARLKKIINAHGIQIVHGQGGRSEFHARIARSLASPGVKYLSTVAMPVEGYDVPRLRKAAYVLLDRFSERFVDRFSVVSEALKWKMIKDHRIHPDKIVRIYNGIEVERYQPNPDHRHRIRDELGVDKDQILIGAVGRLVWQKGFEHLLESMDSVLQAFPHTTLLIVGNGPLKPRLEAMGKILRQREQLLFTGFRSDVRKILAAVDLLAVPSLLEGFPMITLEAMAMEKPVVGTRIDGITEQISHGETGLLVPPRDPRALGEAILRILGNREEAEILGKNARRLVESEFSVEKMVLQTRKLYNELSIL